MIATFATLPVPPPPTFHGLLIGDWAAWAQVGAIVVTGLLAVFVANRQLNAFNNNERLRNSMKLVDDMLKVGELQGVRASPFDTCLEIDAISKDAALAAEYRKMAANRVAFGNSPAVAQEWFLATRSKAAIVVNYYVDLLSLLSMKQLDREFVMPKVKPFILAAYPALVALGYVTGPNVNLKEMTKLYESFVKDARKT
jgi:hypothetical protein